MRAEGQRSDEVKYSLEQLQWMAQRAMSAKYSDSTRYETLVICLAMAHCYSRAQIEEAIRQLSQGIMPNI